MRRRAFGPLAILFVIAACGSTTTQSAAPTVTQGAATASAVAGPLEIRGGDLPPGNYTHSGFEPRITFDLDEGWRGVQNTNGFFDVQQDPDTPDVIAVQFGNAEAVFGEDRAAVEIDEAADAAPNIRENAGLNVIGESPSLMSGLEGYTVEVENATEGDVQVLRVPAGPLAIAPDRRLWMSFFDTPNGVLAVMVGGSVARWKDSLAIAEPVLESVRIGDAAP
ncbi:MAG TPA: hypothetical protein VFU17_03880 [Candidatus Limnocylindrales bacterium]|nr:hypothetical protein [Candidatus Limnocylindrales bacterium]